MQSKLVWRGVTIIVRHEVNWLNTDLDHIEIESTPRTRLPMTGTGYRSHFIHPGDLEEYEDATDFVRRWLDAAALDWDAQIPLF